MNQKRAFRDRLLDGFDRSRIRRELTTVRGRRLRNMSRRYTTMMMGASLAVGGVGIPLSLAEKGNNAPAPSPGSMSGAITQSPTLMPSILAPAPDPQQVAEELAQLRAEIREEVFRAEVPFGDLILAEAKKNDLSPELVAAVVETESQFKPNARSPVGAQGLMQLMPRTGKWMGAKNLRDPQQNVQAGTKYLRYLGERFNGDQTKILAAYNGGEGNVRKYGGVPPFKETRNYVKKVNAGSERLSEQIDSMVEQRLAARQSATGAPTSLAVAR